MLRYFYITCVFGIYRFVCAWWGRAFVHYVTSFEQMLDDCINWFVEEYCDMHH